jgi:hypothetical protein
MMSDFFEVLIPVCLIILGLFIVAITLSVIMAYVIVWYRKLKIVRGMQLISIKFDNLLKVFK